MINTSEGNEDEEGNINSEPNSFPILQDPLQALPVYAHQRYTPPPELPMIGETEQVVIVTEVPQFQETFVYDLSFSLYIATCISLFIPIIGLIFIFVYLCMWNRERNMSEKLAFNILCLITSVSLFFEIFFEKTLYG